MRYWIFCWRWLSSFPARPSPRAAADFVAAAVVSVEEAGQAGSAALDRFRARRRLHRRIRERSSRLEASPRDTTPGPRRPSGLSRPKVSISEPTVFSTEAVQRARSALARSARKRSRRDPNAIGVFSGATRQNQ